MCLTTSKGGETPNEHIGIRVPRGDLTAESLMDPQAFLLTPRTVFRKDNQVDPSFGESLTDIAGRETLNLESRRGLNKQS
jgi:hypothetical protein